MNDLGLRYGRQADPELVRALAHNADAAVSAQAFAITCGNRTKARWLTLL